MARPITHVTAAVGALALVVSIAAGSDVPAAARAKPSAMTTTTWAPLPRFDSTVLWSDCGDGFQCGALTVPVDWSAPTGQTLPLALIRRPAESAGERIGALVI